jgi:hypothetical protein
MASSEKANSDLPAGIANPPTGSEKLAYIRDHVGQIWARARSNAFAHREAAEEFAEKAHKLFKLQLWLGMLSMFSIILLYITLPTDGGGVEISRLTTRILSGGLTLTSVGFSIASLVAGILQNYLGYEKLQILHDHNQHSYLHIAQRAREVKFIGISEERAESILEDLERDFQLLKARGMEPANRHFVAGDALLEKIKRSSAHYRQSFNRPTEKQPPSEAPEQPDQG